MGPAKRGRYHHGDLATALVDAAIEVIGERGVHGFSMAEASRRLGVAVSAPYAHFADRDGLLAAVAVRGFQRFYAALAPGAEAGLAPADRLAAMTRHYVQFAATERPLFQVIYEAGLDKAGHPEIGAAEQLIDEAFMACVNAISGGPGPAAGELASALEATAHGHAMLLLDGGPGPSGEDVERAAARAARATRALIESRRLLSDPAGPAGSGPPGAPRTTDRRAPG
ncbi:MAG TPA: TetR/AcrR family transcriptional regulator [Streptosporangiaceae bacterium]|nr:TetR/AcrR family transcriptional regulator [Streptosporangiaceae bacterium]